MMDENIKRKEFFTAYVEVEGSIRRLLRLLLHDYSLLDDVSQAVALRLWEKYDTYDPARPFGVWARGVAVNVVKEFRRSDKRFERFLTPQGVDALAEAYERSACNSVELSEQIEALRQCLKSLPVRTREIINKRYYELLPFDEVATDMGFSITASYKAVERALKKLGDCVRRKLTPVNAQQ